MFKYINIVLKLTIISTLNYIVFH